jgi:DNA-binding NtrC family response regulator
VAGAPLPGPVGQPQRAATHALPRRRTPALDPPLAGKCASTAACHGTRPDSRAATGHSPELLFEETTSVAGDTPDLALGDWLAHQERDYILRALEANEWRVQDTAKLLNISRKTLWEKMKRLEIQRQEG